MAETDIIALAKTWEYRGSSRVEIEGFQRICTVWNDKRFTKGRGFGRLVVWRCTQIQVDVSVEVEDVKKQFVCLGSRCKPSFLLVAYFAPLGASVYDKMDSGNPVSAFTSTVCRYSEKGPLWVVGDFTVGWGSSRERTHCYNNVCGRNRRREDGAEDRRMRRKGQGVKQRSREATQYIYANRGKYEQELEDRLRGEALTPSRLAKCVKTTARLFLTKTRARDAPWFDAQCVELRRQTLEDKNDRQGAFKVYKSYIKMRKQSHVAELQCPDWARLEAVHKLFLREELGAPVQTPYALLLAKTGRLPIEVEALLITIEYLQHTRKLSDDRLSYQAWVFSHSGWHEEVCRSVARWNVLEERWREGAEMRELVREAAVQSIWSNPSPRLTYYLRDVRTLTLYEEQDYLNAALSRFTRQLISKYRISAHSLRVEEGRWQGLDRPDRICQHCSLNKIEK
ncbi:hypothetical protein R1sor_024036 [Riccia sorocarpa]|uniref:Uncharacterized protein n=1 Tax=Riccia sorocarpa TaxID=122646 RepID=A0ABD3GSJ6_9MARC